MADKQGSALGMIETRGFAAMVEAEMLWLRQLRLN